MYLWTSALNGWPGSSNCGSGREDKRDEPSINESNLMSRFQIGKLVLNNKKFSHFRRVIVVYCESNPANSTTESAVIRSTHPT